MRTTPYLSGKPDLARLDRFRSRKQKSKITISAIANIVSRHTGIPVQTMKTETRKKQIKEARQIAMFFAYVNDIGTLEYIGNYFNRDHTTVSNAKKVIGNFITTNDPIKDVIKQCEREIKRFA